MAVGAGLRNGTRRIKEIVKFDEEELTADILEGRTRSTLRIIDKIERLYAVGLKQAIRLENAPKSNRRACLAARANVARTRKAGAQVPCRSRRCCQGSAQGVTIVPRAGQRN